jgi:hypothetical protein
MAESQQEIAKLEALYQSNPGGRVFTHQAEAYRRAGKLDRAHEIARDGLRRHENYASAHVVLGRIYLDYGRKDDAAEEFNRVLQLDPENRIALRCLGDFERERGRADHALRHYRALEQFDPGDEQLAELIAELERETAPPPEADTDTPAAPDDAPDPFGGPPPAYGPAYGVPADAPGGFDTPATDFEPLPLSMDWPGSARLRWKNRSFGAQTSFRWSNPSTPPPAISRKLCSLALKASQPTVSPPVKRFVSSWLTPSSVSCGGRCCAPLGAMSGARRATRSCVR